MVQWWILLRRRLSNRHGRPRRMLTMDIRRTPIGLWAWSVCCQSESLAFSDHRVNTLYFPCSDETWENFQFRCFTGNITSEPNSSPWFGWFEISRLRFSQNLTWIKFLQKLLFYKKLYIKLPTIAAENFSFSLKCSCTYMNTPLIQHFVKASQDDAWQHLDLRIATCKSEWVKINNLAKAWRYTWRKPELNYFLV